MGEFLKKLAKNVLLQDFDPEKLQPEKRLKNLNFYSISFVCKFTAGN